MPTTAYPISSFSSIDATISIAIILPFRLFIFYLAIFLTSFAWHVFLSSMNLFVKPSLFFPTQHLFRLDSSILSFIVAVVAGARFVVFRFCWEIRHYVTVWFVNQIEQGLNMNIGFSERYWRFDESYIRFISFSTPDIRFIRKVLAFSVATDYAG